MPCSSSGWCPAMAKRLVDFGDKGMAVLNLLNIKTGEESIGGVVYKTKAIKADKGILLNFCPWCGKAINWAVEEGGKDA